MKSASIPALVVSFFSAVNPASAARAADTLTIGRFGTVTLYMPAGAPRSIALFVSGDGGWNQGVIDMARSIAAQDAIVVGIDVRHYLDELAKMESGCASLAIDFENLSHSVQKQLDLREYLSPVLIGYSSGATVVYATLAQAPPGTFGGAMSLGFCPDQDFRGRPLCPGAGLQYVPNKRGDFVFEPAPHLRDTWIALQGQRDQVCDARAVDSFAARVAHAEVVRLPAVGHGFSVQRDWLPQFRTAYAQLSARGPAGLTPAPQVKDLPLIEVAAAGDAAKQTLSTRFVLLLSGDGGWAGLDQDVAAAFAAKGVPVVGFNTLKYFWNQRTPEQTAADVARTLEHYLGSWQKEQVDLVGYSFGAEVLPFIVARLPENLRARVGSISMIGPSATASFEIHVGDWLPGEGDAGVPLRPELKRLQPQKVLCLYGKGDSDALCPALDPTEAVSAQIGTGHHLSGEADAIVERILAFAQSGR